MAPNPPIDAERLVKAQATVGISSKELASRAGISLQYLCDIQAGRRTLKRNPELVRKLAEALDVPRDWIQRVAA